MADYPGTVRFRTIADADWSSGWFLRLQRFFLKFGDDLHGRSVREALLTILDDGSPIRLSGIREGVPVAVSIRLSSVEASTSRGRQRLRFSGVADAAEGFRIGEITAFVAICEEGKTDDALVQIELRDSPLRSD